MHGEPNNDEIDYHEHEPIVLRDLERTEKQKKNWITKKEIHV